MRAAQEALLDEAAVDKWENGRPPAGTREAEFTFEYEFHFLLVSAQQLAKALRKLGFAGFDKDLAGPVKDVRDWYTHFEEPEGSAFQSFVARKESADPSHLVLTVDELDIGGGVLRLSQLEAALAKIGSELPSNERRVLAEEAE